jgi:hypothetical protein
MVSIEFSDSLLLKIDSVPWGKTELEKLQL